MIAQGNQARLPLHRLARVVYSWDQGPLSPARAARHGSSVSATQKEVLTAAISSAALCVMCLARKTGAAPLSAIGALAGIGQRVKITTETARCEDCARETLVYRIK